MATKKRIVTLRLNEEMDQVLTRYWEVMTDKRISKNEFMERIILSYTDTNAGLFKRIVGGEVKVLQDAGGRLKYVSMEKYKDSLKKVDSLKVPKDDQRSEKK